MWQLQWVIGLIPDAVLSLIYWAMIVAGITGVIASWLGKWIPFYGRYTRILKPVGIVLLVLGVWLRGGYDTEMRWRNQVAEMQAKVEAAQAAAAATNRAIEEKVETKTVVIREKAKILLSILIEKLLKKKKLSNTLNNALCLRKLSTYTIKQQN